MVRVGWRGPVGLGMEGDGVGRGFPVRCAGPGASGCEGDMQGLGSRCSQEVEGGRAALHGISMQGYRGSLESRRAWNALVLALGCLHVVHLLVFLRGQTESDTGGRGGTVCPGPRLERHRNSPCILECVPTSTSTDPLVLPGLERGEAERHLANLGSETS